MHCNLPTFFLLNIAGSSYKGGGSGGRGGGRNSNGGGGGIPPWKRYTKKTLGRQAEATLESVWMRTQWPSDDTIASLWNLHRLRRDQVLTWFQDKRKKERGGGGGSKATGSASSSVVNSIGPKTDWDAEWDPIELGEGEEDGI
jgi:Homeodomain